MSTAPIGPNKTFDMLARGTTTTANGIVRVPPEATAIVANMTVVTPSTGTYLTVYAPAPAHPLSSNINAAKGQTVPNLVVSAIGSGSKVRIYNNLGNSPVIADLAGYYAP